MKAIRVATLISVGCSQAFLASQDAPPSGAVEGTVVNSVTGAGIGGTYVELSINRFATGYYTTTDVAGHFRIAGMRPGSYHIGARKDGFGSSARDFGFFLNSELHVASGGDPVKVELRLTPTGTMSGRVLGPDGKPAAGVEVSLYQWHMAKAPVTDRDGRFALENVGPGSYTLVARPPPSAQPEQASDGTRTAMVTTYYPSVADLSLAQQIVFRGDGDLSDYEMRMQTAPVHRVRGIVLDDKAQPSPKALLDLFRIPDGPPRPIELASRTEGSTLFALGVGPRHGSAEATVVSGNDGRFEFPAVPSGDWTVEAKADPMRAAQPNGRIVSRGTTNAIVAGRDIDDLQLDLKVQFRLTPIIEWMKPGSQEASNTRPSESPIILVNTDTNQLFDLRSPLVFPGHYQAVDKPGVSSRVFLGESEVTGQTFSLIAGGPTLRIVARISSGTVRGTVEKGGGAIVVLIPQRVEGVVLGQTVVCEADGSFELNIVSPGDYSIAVFDRMDIRSPSVATMLGLVPLRGRGLKMEEGSTASVTLSVIPAPQ